MPGVELGLQAHCCNHSQVKFLELRVMPITLVKVQMLLVNVEIYEQDTRLWWIVTV